MKFIWILLFALPLFGAKILDYNIYPREDRVDITFSFDVPYKEGISQKKKDGIIIFTLNAQSAKEEDKTLNSSIIKKVKIFSESKKTFIALSVGDKIQINADTIGEYGLRLRAQKEGVNLTTKKSLDEKSKEVSMQEYDFTNYILVVSILILLFIALWFLKIYLKQKHPLDRNFNLIFQRPLDRYNQLVVFEYGLKRYTMVIGKSNIILETTEAVIKNEEQNKTSQKPKEKDFDSYFEENKQRLQNLLLKQNN
ncbi:hypothetical protein A7X81_08895 [Campylobacter ornithocola]|uniref:Uncharacterized protein n=1 Tax=Campylobacter ornithocola TaxID=1848766 RepID=A0A6M8MQJ5_9BACT|nr:hypothetical protein [Campylobacter ornithocola]OCX43343.1 hypothetical protein A7X81_08895 [Campylobacter ornithocola]QKF56742.1 putative membrane protein [Campylobacter ornithocola]